MTYSKCILAIFLLLMAWLSIDGHAEDNVQMVIQIEKIRIKDYVIGESTCEIHIDVYVNDELVATTEPVEVAIDEDIKLNWAIKVNVMNNTHYKITIELYAKNIHGEDLLIDINGNDASMDNGKSLEFDYLSGEKAITFVADGSNDGNDFEKDATIYGKIYTFKPNLIPSVFIGFPQNNSTVSGEIKLVGTAVDPDGLIEKVELKIDNESWTEAYFNATTHMWEYMLNTTKYPNGNHTVYIRAFDGKNYSKIETISIIINNKNEEKKKIPEFEIIAILFSLSWILIWRKAFKKIKE